MRTYTLASAWLASILILLSCSGNAPAPIETNEESDTETFAVISTDDAHLGRAEKEISEIGLLLKDKHLLVHLRLVAQTGEGNQYDVTLRTWNADSTGKCIRSRAIAKGGEVKDSVKHTRQFVFDNVSQARLNADLYTLRPSKNPQFTYVSDKNWREHLYIYLVRTSDFTEAVKYTINSPRYKALKQFIDEYEGTEDECEGTETEDKCKSAEDKNDGTKDKPGETKADSTTHKHNTL